ncbi:MAG: CARDB domain-containing protein, partial [Chitinophagales bacterium]
KKSKSIGVRIPIDSIPANAKITLSAVVKADVPDANQDNNTDKCEITLLLPDLTVTSVKPVGFIIQGSPAILNVGVANLSNVASGRFTIKIYQDENTKVLASKVVGQLNGSKNYLMALKVPKDFTLKKNSFRVVIDADSQVVETDETNNVLYYPSKR